MAFPTCEYICKVSLRSGLCKRACVLTFWEGIVKFYSKGIVPIYTPTTNVLVGLKNISSFYFFRAVFKFTEKFIRKPRVLTYFPPLLHSFLSYMYQRGIFVIDI